MRAASVPPPSMFPGIAMPSRAEQTRAGLDLAREGIEGSYRRLAGKFTGAKQAMASGEAAPTRTALELLEREAASLAALCRATAATLADLQRGRKR